MDSLERLAQHLALGEILAALKRGYGGYSVLHHWKQGEFHHDLVVRLAQPRDLPGSVLIVATNCNGGVKEVLAFDRVPDRDALWHYRCPGVSEFSTASPLVGMLGAARTIHWFDPSELLAPDARSELKPEFRKRQRGGGWEPAY